MISKTSPIFKECSKTHKLPFKMTPFKERMIKKQIARIQGTTCMSLNAAYSLAAYANGFYYILKTHKMPGKWIKGPFINVGTRITRKTHFKLESFN